MEKSRWLLGAAILFLSSAVFAQSPSLSLSTVSLTVAPQGTDSFALQGSYSGISLDGAESVILTLGPIRAVIPMDQFLPQDQPGLLKYEDTTGLNPYWFSTLYLDTANQTFNGWATGIALTGVNNPFAVTLGTGSASVCTVVRVKRGGDGSYAPAEGEPRSRPCLIPNPVVFRPVMAGTPTQVDVAVSLAPSEDLDPNSLLLTRIDDNGEATGEPLCRFVPQGSEYTCSFPVSEAAAGAIPTAVQATAGDVTILSPASFIPIVREGTDQDDARLAEVNAALDQQKQNFDQWGDSVHARVVSLLALRARLGAGEGWNSHPVGLVADGLSIGVRLSTGVPLTWILNRLGEAQPATEEGQGVPAVAATKRTPADASTTVAATAPARAAGSQPQCGEFKRDIVRNGKLVVFSADVTFFGKRTAPVYERPFRNAKCPSEGAPLRQEDTTSIPAALAAWANYGTVIISSHGVPDQYWNGTFVTALPYSTRLNPLDYALARVAYYPGAGLPARDDDFASVPSTSRLLPRLNKTFIYGAFCYSNRMKKAFTPEGSGNAFLGFDPLIRYEAPINDSMDKFTKLLMEYAKAGDLTGDTVKTAVLTGNSELAFFGNPKLSSPSRGESRGGYSVEPGATLDLEAKLEGAESCDGAMELKWKNFAGAGHLTSQAEPSKRDDYQNTDRRADYTGSISAVTLLDQITVDFRPNAASSDPGEPNASRACTSVGVSSVGLSVTRTGVFTWGDLGPLDLTPYPKLEVTSNAPFEVSDSALGGSSSLRIEQTGPRTWVVTQKVQAASSSPAGALSPTTWNRVDLQLKNGPGSKQIRTKTESSVSGACQGLDITLAGPLTWRQFVDGTPSGGCPASVELKGYSVGPQGTAGFFLNLAVVGGKGVNSPGGGTVTTTIELLDSTDPVLP